MSNTQASHSLTTDPSASSKCVRVCQNRTCKKQGAAKVLAAFKASVVPGVMVTPTGCLGQCGNGPMVLVLPDRVWYSRVCPQEVPMVVEQHLLNGHEVKKMQ
ncbi:(2Fe-2S) ferredoxin domain-containing protein [Scytonema hofmannii FACHB-248]|uniref:(2Fe-2S) ferredoxin domain-containing protein n=1 Tax=Scytonema hofmannii FACHB-248 TaxID=1842502 RepID=A0ABR8GVM8_9CYAN|nr:MULTISPECIES: (2Fe-2S) ferredoxin domain-containing protein [Nostocales]MBD2607556.1 (2Fe-2S) ferredoxin domain-containing protein [Scytonema hofmannii FACHB-248]